MPAKSNNRFMSEPNQKPGGISLCPNTFWGALSVAIICVAVVIIVLHVAGPKAVAPRRLWTPVVVETNGTQTIIGETRQMEFWTPSARTKGYLKKEDSAVSDRDKWQIIDNDEIAFKFGALLHSNRSVLGYRRVEVWGHGLTTFKPGWWWSLNVTTNYQVGQLAQAYHDYWNSRAPVFIEVIDNRGNEE
jgi:hypothetical protein